MITAIMPAHSPHPGRLSRTLDAISAQTLATGRWECIVVDNGSTPPIDAAVLPGFVRLVREPKLGLTWARLKGVIESSTDLVVFVDDDNVLSPVYLNRALEIMNGHPDLGAIGGKSQPIWESGEAPPAWLEEFKGNLALRDLGDQPIIQEWKPGYGYPDAAPIGAGMVVRRHALDSWIASLSTGSVVTDRRGNALTSGGDNDIVLNIVRAGYKVGYFPELTLGHIISRSRLTRDYTARLSRGISRSWVEVLAAHGIRPWGPVAPWTISLRKAKAYFSYQAWLGPAQFVRWHAACGHFEGRGMLWRIRRASRSEPSAARTTSKPDKRD
jgi:glycosyltransferase involved in cell wall biosynthesis